MMGLNLKKMEDILKRQVNNYRRILDLAKKEEEETAKENFETIAKLQSLRNNVIKEIKEIDERLEPNKKNLVKKLKSFPEKFSMQLKAYFNEIGHLIKEILLVDKSTQGRMVAAKERLLFEINAISEGKKVLGKYRSYKESHPKVLDKFA